MKLDEVEIDELKTAMKSLANDEAAGENDMTAGMLKTLDDSSLIPVQTIKIWQEKTVPE